MLRGERGIFFFRKRFISKLKTHFYTLSTPAGVAFILGQIGQVGHSTQPSTLPHSPLRAWPTVADCRRPPKLPLSSIDGSTGGVFSGAAPPALPVGASMAGRNIRAGQADVYHGHGPRSAGEGLGLEGPTPARLRSASGTPGHGLTR